MRALPAIVLAFLLAGCSAPVAPDGGDDGAAGTSSPSPGPSGQGEDGTTGGPLATVQPSTTSSTRPPQSWTPTSTHCGATTTALWAEPGVHQRAVQRGDGRNPAREGFPADAQTQARYGPANVTYVADRDGASATGKLNELVLTWQGREARGSFLANATPEEVRSEFRAFAAKLEDLDGAALDAQAAAFQANLTEDGTYRLRLSGPFKVGEAAGRVFAEQTRERWLGSNALALHSDEFEVGLALETVGSIKANRLDWMEFSAQGFLREVWQAANQTFDGWGWPRPDLRQALASTFIC